MSSSKNQVEKISVASLLITLGIIYGDIGTSPLYVMKAIIGTTAPITLDAVFGGISCVFWTLTIQTTFKYIFLTLKADNHGEGGIFSLYTLVRRRVRWLVIPAMVGGAALLADGMITPPISVSSAVEGLELLLHREIPVVPIVVVIISVLFFFQRFGTSVVGRAFGPIMLVWFSMLGILGLMQIVKHPEVLAALNPAYAIKFLSEPGGFWLLGAVFLCTTGAEALYSDLGHCGRRNIRVSWVFVKTSLMLNYLGQGAWLISFAGQPLANGNPFYGIMPSWFLGVGIVIATAAAIIASQALISGSFTLVSEAIRLNLLPKVQVIYPTQLKGQLYIPSVNFFLWAGCVGVMLYFQESAKMEAAYGLAITVTMLSTTVLLSAFLKRVRVPTLLVGLLLVVFIIVEGSFFVANVVKFAHGGFVTVIMASMIVLLMWIWMRAHGVKQKLTDYIKIANYKDQLINLSQDQDVPKYATNLVFLSNAGKDDEVEQKVIYSILQKQPKRADVYWFVHVEVTDQPYTMEYKVNVVADQDVIKVRFRLGFRVQQRMNVFMRLVVEDMVKREEVDINSRYSSLKDRNIAGDFRFVILEEFLSYENDLPAWEAFLLNTYISIKSVTATPDRWFGLDTSAVTVEKVPLVVRPVTGLSLTRIES